ncbi:MAG: DUF1593 domain-containing protein [Tannerellaceae bacterium]|jgi:hypothetical protein|nr:DUF1593 domain-containing protein [Tannerellaceae bacterium]
MKRILLLLFFSASVMLGAYRSYAGQMAKPRVIAMTDGEVDDQCSMIRFLLHSNDMDVAAIIQTNSVFQRGGWSKTGWIEKQLDAYEKVHPNLIVHDPSYPTAEELRSKLFLGDEDSTHIVVDTEVIRHIPGVKPMIDPTNWPDTPGSDKIVETLLEKDPRKVYIQAWGGGNTAAKAFQKLKVQHPSDYERAVKKAVMYNIWYQDGAGNYIETSHPDVTMLVSYHFSGTWDYGSQRYTDGFADKYLHNSHGPLAALYPQDYVSEGDSPAFLYTLGCGLRGYEDPTYGGWGGQFYRVNGLKNVYRDVDRGSYLRWVEVANRDFESRLQWCISDKFADANHKPVISVQGGVEKRAKAGETVTLDAYITEPDPLDIDALWAKYAALYEQLGFNKERFAEIAPHRFPKYNAFWWQYKEAGTYNGYVDITAVDSGKCSFVAPRVDKPETLHLILEVTDKGSPALTAFARVIVTIFPIDNRNK